MSTTIQTHAGAVAGGGRARNRQSKKKDGGVKLPLQEAAKMPTLCKGTRTGEEGSVDKDRRATCGVKDGDVKSPLHGPASARMSGVDGFVFLAKISMGRCFSMGVNSS